MIYNTLYNQTPTLYPLYEGRLGTYTLSGPGPHSSLQLTENPGRANTYLVTFEDNTTITVWPSDPYLYIVDEDPPNWNDELLGGFTYGNGLNTEEYGNFTKPVE